MHINILLSTASIPVVLRPLLSVFIDNFFDTPVIRNGVQLEYEEVVKQLEKFTVNYRIDSGANFEVPETIRVRVQVEKEHYATAVDWIKSLFWDSVFTQKRLATVVQKLLQEIPEEKRSGDDMSYSVARAVTQSRESVGKARDTLVKAVYLKKIAYLLKNDESRVIGYMEELRNALFKAENMRVLVIADVEKLENPLEPWKQLLQGHDGGSGSVMPLDRRIARLSPLGKQPQNTTIVVPLTTIDSSYSLHIAKGPHNISDQSLPALILALSLLQTVEGPLWTAVRGTGLAYGCSFSRSMDSGLLTFSIYRAPDAWKAFSAARTVVADYAEGRREFEKHLLEGARSGVVVGFADNEPNMAAAGVSTFTNQVV